MNVEVGVLLAGKAGIREVFCGGGRAHGDEGVIHLHLLAELGVGVLDILDDVFGHFLCDDHSADVVGHLAQQRGVLDVGELLELIADLLVQPRPFHELTI